MQKPFNLAAVIFAIVLLSGCSGSDPEPEVITESVIIEKVSKSSGISRSQTQIGLSALMKLSEEKLTPDEFTKLTADFPGGENLYNFGDALGFAKGSIKTQAEIVQILVNLGVSPVDAGKFLASVLSVSKNMGGDVYSLLSKVYEK